ncbi:MAG: hypothetical protein ACU833_13250 [Gammaproteobacteria bacterium]
MLNSDPSSFDLQTAPSRPDRARLFYCYAAALLLALTFLGFQPFYLHGRGYPDQELAAPIRNLIVLHGVGMSLWVLLFMVQPLLVAADRRSVHRIVGGIGAAVAAVLVVLGWRLAIEATLIKPPDVRIWGLSPKQFLAVPIVSIVIFAGFVGAGVWNRRRPEVHRAMMLSATLAVVSAAVSRIDGLSALYVGRPWEAVFGPFFWTLAVGAGLLAAKCLLARSLDRWLAAGVAGLAVLDALIMQLAATDAWERFADFLLR